MPVNGGPPVHMVSSTFRRILPALVAVVALAAPLKLRGEDAPALTPPERSVGTSTAASAPALEVVSLSRDRMTIRFSLPRAGIVRISLMTPDGKEMGTLASGLTAAGENRLEIDVSRIPAGEYHCTLQSRDGSVSTRVVIGR